MKWIRLRISGSSPLARGLLTSDLVSSALIGIIPARAGFTSVIMSRAATLKDHPRSRGVYVAGAVVDHVDDGSSPLARGLHPPLRPARAGDRIIPARAGFT